MSVQTSTSAASADARIDVTSSGIPTAPPRALEDKPPAKRPRFTKTPSGRRGGAAYKQAQKPTSLQIVPRIRYFPIFTSNMGCRHLVATCYRVMQGKDYRLAQNITQLQLSYVTVLSFLNRLVQCGLNFGYSIPSAASRLKQVTTGIQLPSVLANYVESIGLVELASGAQVVPFVTNYANLLLGQNRHLYVNPADILTDADRDIPEGDWAIDEEWIIAYNASTTRASRSGMQFRTIDNSTLLGRSEMLVSYVRFGEDLLPKAPQRMSEAEAQLGAAYRFRDYDEFREWGENSSLLHDTFTAIPFSPRIMFSDLCVAAFKGMKVSTD